MASRPPPPGTGTFLGRGLASSPALGHGAEARGWAGGLSMGLCACSQGASVAEPSASTLGPQSPTHPAPRSPAQHRAALPSQAPSLGVGAHSCPLLNTPPRPRRACLAQATEGEHSCWGVGVVHPRAPKRVKWEEDRPCSLARGHRAVNGNFTPEAKLLTTKPHCLSYSNGSCFITHLLCAKLCSKALTYLTHL